MHPPFKIQKKTDYKTDINSYLLFFDVATLKGGCTRFEVEHISCKLISFIWKSKKNNNCKNIKGGYTRFEVEHISCKILLYIGKI